MRKLILFAALATAQAMPKVCSAQKIISVDSVYPPDEVHISLVVKSP